MTAEDLPWVAVTGFGAHIKATPVRLVIQHKGTIKEIPLSRIPHLLVIGGHTLHSSVITTLIKNNIPVSFFEADGTPVSVVRPYGDNREAGMRTVQAGIPKHRYAVMIARGALQARLLALHELEENRTAPLLYEGELDFLHKAYEELEYLIKLDEVRRLHLLTTNMYYEIIARTLPPELGFRRRAVRPRNDPVNAMLSLSYAMLYGSAMVPVLASRLDPDIGLLSEGPGSLVNDLIDPFRPVMVDRPVLELAAAGIGSDEYEQSVDRCLLADDCVVRLQSVIKKTIQPEKIQEQVRVLTASLCNGGKFTVLC